MRFPGHNTDARPQRVIASEWPWLGLVLAFPLLLSILPLVHGPGWGDDFAGYLLQAQSILAGAPQEEVDLNGALLGESDWRVGPNAYPWGFPLLLAAVNPITGWNPVAINMIQMLSLALSGVCTYLIARKVRLLPLAALASTVLALWQPGLIAIVGSVGSDLPFLAISLVTLLVAIPLIETNEAPTPRQTNVQRVALVSLLGVLAFSFRSNGAVLIGAIGAGLALNLLCTTGRKIGAAVELLTFGVLTSLGVWAYFQLPDGSLVHMSYLSLDSASLVNRLGDHIVALGSLVPFRILPHALRPAGVMALAVLSLVGAWRLGRIGLVLVLYVGGHLALLTVFRFDGGPRYYFPIIPILAILSVVGVRRLQEHAARSVWLATIGSSVRPGTWALLLLLACGIPTAYLVYRDSGWDSHPYTPETQALMREVERQFPEDAKVSFFKPRLLRWMTGRRGVLIREKNHAGEMDGIILYPPVGLEFQLSQKQIEELGQFELAAHVHDFLIFVRRAEPGARSSP